MAVQLETTTKRFRGLSTDIKPGHERTETDDGPQVIPIGSVFTEADTGKRFVWRGSWPWVRQEQTIESLMANLIDVNEGILAMLAAIKRGHEEHLWEDDVEVEDL